MPSAAPTPRLLRPAGWPIAVKLALALLAVSIAPMAVTVALEVRQARRGAEQAEHTSLTAIARSTAGRLDQLVEDTGRVAALLAGDAEVEAFLADVTGASPELRASVERTLRNVAGDGRDVSTVLLLDARGTTVLGNRADEIGRDLTYRQYYRRAIAGDGHVSEILTGSTTRRPGMYFSRRVDAGPAPARRPVGVAVIKLAGERIADLVTSARPASGSAFLVDRWGVVVGHSDPSLLYKSLAPLSPEVLALPEFEERFSSVGVDRIEPLGLDDLGRRVASAAAPLSTAFVVPGGSRQIAGVAPLSQKRWAVVVHRPEADLIEPLAVVTRRSLSTALLVGAVVTLIALLLSRAIVRPIERLTESSRAILRGEFRAARVDVTLEDEVGALAAAFNTMARGLEERERELEIFGRLVSPEVREKLLTGRLELGGEMRRAAVLFSDIRGFSSIAETMDPHAVVALLNEYLTAMTEATSAYNGYINNFIGDAIVVVFGAPIPQTDAERRAVSAALAMRRALAALNERRVARGDPALETGIGIAVGDMVAGQIGSPERMLYTVIGDAVNVAARLESLTKEHAGKPILITRRVADALDHGALGLEPLGPIKLKGRSEPVDVVAVLG